MTDRSDMASDSEYSPVQVLAMCLCRGLSDHLRRAAIETGPDVPRNVAIVIDAGADQAKVMSKERELAVAPINELSGAGTTFTIDGAGI